MYVSLLASLAMFSLLTTADLSFLLTLCCLGKTLQSTFLHVLIEGRTHGGGPNSLWGELIVFAIVLRGWQ